MKRGIEGERESAREGKERQRESERVFVCEREIERERERETCGRCRFPYQVWHCAKGWSQVVFSHQKSFLRGVWISVCVRECAFPHTYIRVYIYKHLHVYIADGFPFLYTVQHDFQVVVRTLEHTCRDGGFVGSRVSRQTIVKGRHSPFCMILSTIDGYLVEFILFSWI